MARDVGPRGRVAAGPFGWAELEREKGEGGPKRKFLFFFFQKYE
jgi:hypothetical protein